MQEARHQFQESPKELEQDTLGGLDMAAQQLDRALESVILQDVQLAATVITDDDRTTRAADRDERRQRCRSAIDEPCAFR